MNYGDGMYAGQFVGAMYAAAFFESDPVKIIETALRAIPPDSQYAEMVRDLVAWYRADPDDWEADVGEVPGEIPPQPRLPESLQRRHRLQDQRRLRADGSALRQARPGPDHPHRLPLRHGLRLQSVQLGRRAVHDHGLPKLPDRFNTGLDETA